MTADYAEMEREFLSYLEVDTGRDLAAWMAAIDEARLPDRNAIIDWLRLRGFLFQRASWLERIHHNGGRPIYLSEVPASVRGVPPRAQPAPAPPSPPPASAAAVPPRPPLRVVGGVDKVTVLHPSGPPMATTLPLQPNANAGPGPEQPSSRSVPPAGLSQPSTAPPLLMPLAPTVLAIIASAKAFAPLASHLMKVCREAVPGTAVAIEGDGLLLSTSSLPYALMQPSPRGVRLVLALATIPVEPPFTPAPKGRPGQRPEPVAGHFTHALVLDDMRRIDPALIAVIKTAAASA